MSRRLPVVVPGAAHGDTSVSHMPGSRKLLIVANRLPINRAQATANSRWEISPGGLVTALSPILKQHGGAWIGWPGTSGKAPRPFEFDGIRIVPMRLSQKEVHAYYEGFSNETIWPLYHDAIRPPKFVSEWWSPYLEVNWRFARAAAAEARRGQLVWIHDYHLQLVPRMLRELRPDVRIGFFLHIPFPPEELFAWLPWRREILQGLLGADVIGFQTMADVRDFSRAARMFTSATGSDTSLRYRGRHVQIGCYPISIDFDAFASLAAKPRVIQRAQEIRRRVGSTRRILLSVDRLDYTKGLDARMIAFEQLLARRIATVDDCLLMQVAVPSRESVDEYAKIRGHIEQTVGRINGDHSVPGRVAVHYYRRNLKREELVAYYLAADIMLVTPLRDGMNLVAKEYVAVRGDNSGVLVLSEFAGAAQELIHALLVNPRDTDGMVRALDTALHLPLADARLRMSRLRAQVRRHDVFAWARGFVEALQK